MIAYALQYPDPVWEIVWLDLLVRAQAHAMLASE